MEDQSPVPETLSPKAKRPVLLTALCIFASVFFGLIALILLVALFYSGSFMELINTYTDEPVSYGQLMALLSSMFLLVTAAVAGIYLMWRMKRTGYYVFSIPILTVCIFQLSMSRIPVFSTWMLVMFIILFGLFFTKLR